jgi:hypothetical protein
MCLFVCDCFRSVPGFVLPSVVLFLLKNIFTDVDLFSSSLVVISKGLKVLHYNGLEIDDFDTMSEFIAKRTGFSVVVSF